MESFILRCSWFNIWKVWVSRSLINQSVFLQHSSRNIYSKNQEIGDFGITIPPALVKFHKSDFQPILQLFWDFHAQKWNLEDFIPKKPEKSDFKNFKSYILGQSKKNTDIQFPIQRYMIWPYFQGWPLGQIFLADVSRKSAEKGGKRQNFFGLPDWNRLFRSKVGLCKISCFLQKVHNHFTIGPH